MNEDELKKQRISILNALLTNLGVCLDQATSLDEDLGLPEVKKALNIAKTLTERKLEGVTNG
jgi:hypothetical protein